MKKLLIDEDWCRRKILEHPEPDVGLLAVSPEIYREMMEANSMTTKVRVINFGPDPVKVKCVETGDREKVFSEQPVSPGSVSGEIYVHLHQDIVIEEQRVPGPSNPPRPPFGREVG